MDRRIAAIALGLGLLGCGCSEDPIDACAHDHWLDEHPVEKYGCVPAVAAEYVVVVPVAMVFIVINPDGASSQYATDPPSVTDAGVSVPAETLEAGTAEPLEAGALAP